MRVVVLVRRQAGELVAFDQAISSQKKNELRAKQQGIPVSLLVDVFERLGHDQTGKMTTTLVVKTIFPKIYTSCVRL